MLYYKPMNWIKKIKRNDPCWCGSGKKYKHCHIAYEETINKLMSKGHELPSKQLIKTNKEIEGIKRSCQLTKKILNNLNSFITKDITTDDINNYVYEETIKHNAIPAPLNYKGFPKSICTSINEVVCHGIPSNYKLKEGDIINVDVTCILDGFYGDSCRMYEITPVSKEAKKLINVTKECLELSIEAIKPYQPTNVIGNVIHNHASKHNYGVVHMFGGHGIGVKFHEEPFIYHCRKKEPLMIMLPGMVFTIEPMINEGSANCTILDDNWTAITVDKKLSAQWEHTILITEYGAEVLT